MRTFINEHRVGARSMTDPLARDLKKKMILLSGPRQSGKSTLARSLMDEKGIYLNWDIRSDQKIIREASWPKDSTLVILDELHKFAKWKNFLKGLADEFKNKPPLLVTGSAKLDTFRKQGDALTGRFFHYRLHPIDVAESKFFLANSSADTRLSHLLQSGGFPEAFLNPNQAERLRNDRFDLVLQEDLRDLSKTNSIRGLQLLIELLRERVGAQINYSNLAQDLSVSAPTVKQWIELLERLYVIFLVTPYSQGLARGIRKEPKAYFYDCAAAYNDSAAGQRLENAVACALLKFCHFERDTKGKAFQLHYFRDREKREVDFIVTLERKPYFCIEVKSSDETLSQSLAYLHTRIKPSHGSIQLVRQLRRERETQGIEIKHLANWLDALILK